MQQAIVLIGVVLLIGAGTCLFDGDQPREDVCLVLVAVMSIPALPFALALAGQIPPALDLAFPRFCPDLAAPPPRG